MSWIAGPKGIKFYNGTKFIYRAPGEEVPEADSWRSKRNYVKIGMLQYREEPGKTNKVLTGSLPGINVEIESSGNTGKKKKKRTKKSKAKK